MPIDSAAVPLLTANRYVANPAAADRHLSDCHLCPHHCGRARSSAAGLCRVAATTYIASEMLHIGEEVDLCPSHAIFFSGCTATCRFCTAARFAFRPTYGVALTPRQLAGRIEERQKQGARSISFIGGDPAPHIPFILKTLEQLGGRRTIPTVLNSNFYLTNEALDLLEGSIDIYLPDLKFGPLSGELDCGTDLGGMPNYWATVTGNIQRVQRQGSRTIVRHLLMPGHIECCTEPILYWLAEQSGIAVSLLTQYLAPAHAQGSIARSLYPSEIEQARRLATTLQLNLIR